MDHSFKPRAWLGTASAVLLLAVAAVVLWPRLTRTAAPGSAFRYLPPDFTVAAQVSLESLREAPLFRRLAERLMPQDAAEWEREYQDFVLRTGFNCQRDLEGISLVVGGPPKKQILSLVAEGLLERARLVSYLEAQAAAKSLHRGHTVYLLQGQSGPYRLAFLDAKRLAISTGPSQIALESILDRVHSGGQSAEQRLQAWEAGKRIPTGSQAWLVADLTNLGAETGPTQAGPYTLDILRGGRLLFLSGKVTADKWELNAEVECATESDAQRIAGGLRGLGGLLRAAAASSSAGAGHLRPRPSNATDPALSQILDSLTISVAGSRLAMKLTADGAVLHRLAPEASRAPGSPASPAQGR